MYSEKFTKSIKAVEEARDKNISLEPRRMTAQEKEDLLKAYHPDYKTDEFEELKIGPNKGDKVPYELAEILQAHSRISADSVDLEKPDYETFICIDLCKKAIKNGGISPACVNAANETANRLFRERKIKFNQIGEIVSEALINAPDIKEYSLEDVYEINNWADNFVRERIK